ncbi:MAG: rod shape-determining protein MreD [Pseudomonadota bacterium]
MAAVHARPEEILLPVRPGFVLLTLVVAFLLNVLPFTGAALALRPDFVALVLLYWCIHDPRRFGIGSAWFIGLISDVASGTLFGQHALAYSVLAFLGIVLRRRILGFSLGSQVLHVAPLLVAGKLVLVVVALAGGAAFPGWPLLTAPLLGAALWPVISFVFLIPRKPGRGGDEV